MDSQQIKKKLDSILGEIGKVPIDDLTLKYYCPNQICKWRVNTLFKKEPSTIEWLNSIQKGEHLLDVGANVGMYSIYAALVRRCTVTSFEPESQNFAILCKNIFLNDAEAQITPFPIAFSDSEKISKLYLSRFDWDGGGSCHTAGEEIGFDLSPRKSTFTQGIFTTTIDNCIANNLIPFPNFIKIDVDGLEHKVIEGAINTIKNPKLKSICIEINMNLKEHIETCNILNKYGFVADQNQIKKSVRQDGAFKGCAEIIFDRPLLDNVIIHRYNINDRHEEVDSNYQNTNSAFSYAANRIVNSKISKQPFPYIFTENIFDNEYYSQIISNFPQLQDMTPLNKTDRVRSDGSNKYKQRLVIQLDKESATPLSEKQIIFWDSFSKSLASKVFAKTLFKKFYPWIANRVARNILSKDKKFNAHCDILLVNDQTNYKIGPHTDHPERIFSLLFYLPEASSKEELGTSIYIPKDESFTCKGGPHYNPNFFKRVATMPYKQNSLFVFPKTINSFHGVEELMDEGVNRRLIIANFREYKLKN